MSRTRTPAWQEQELDPSFFDVELQALMKSIMENPLKTPEPQTPTPQQDMLDMPSDRSTPKHAMPEQTSEERKRYQNKIGARKHRARRKIADSLLEKRLKQLNEKNAKLKALVSQVETELAIAKRACLRVFETSLPHGSSEPDATTTTQLFPATQKRP